MVVGIIGTIFSVPGQTIGFSAFTDSVIDALKLSRVQLTTAYLVGTVGSGFLLPWGGRLYDRFGARFIFMMSTVMLGLVLLLLSGLDTICNSFSALFHREQDVMFTLSILTLSILILRFSGQGMMTMISRNMLGKWFRARLGSVSGVMGVAISGGFTWSIFVLNYCVRVFGWKGAWILLSVIIGLGMTLFGWLFYRDNPDECELPQDGLSLKKKNRSLKHNADCQAEFTVKQAQKTVAFWAVTLALSIQALVITGITFHINSIGNEVGKTIAESISIFPPITMISIVVGILVGWGCSRMSLKYFVMIMIVFQMLGFWGMSCFGTPMGYWLAVTGIGVSGGFFGPLSTVAMPHYFGLKHLGAISGKMTSGMVISSGLGPLLMAWSLKYFLSYKHAFYLCMVFPAIVFVISLKANRPVIKRENEAMPARAHT